VTPHEEVRIAQATQAIRYLTKHPWATSAEVARGCPSIRSVAMWSAVRPYAHALMLEVGGGRALANIIIDGKSCWGVTRDENAVREHDIRRLRHLTTRSRTLAEQAGTQVLLLSTALHSRAIGQAVMKIHAAAQQAVGTYELVTAAMEADHAVFIKGAREARQRWHAS
jgi:hypothetical protein